MSAPSLTKKQQAALDAIVRYMSDHEWQSPSVRELTSVIGASSTSHTWHFLEALQAWGYITMTPKRARSIRLTGVGVPRPVCPHCGHEVAA